MSKTINMPMTDVNGIRHNVIYTYDDDREVCPVHHMATEDGREIRKTGDQTFSRRDR